VGISGSLRSDSTNTRLLESAARLSIDGMTISITDLVGQLPLFSPDIDAETVESVQAWTAQLRTCDAIIVSTPEYARGYPGALKNAFDWLVQGDGFVEKPFMFLTASKRASISQSTLASVLETMSGIHIKDADCVIGLLGTSLDVDDIVADEDFRTTIQQSLRTFARKLQK
jgi:NAD(P)H-dependent FMN reductase